MGFSWGDSVLPRGIPVILPAGIFPLFWRILRLQARLSLHVAVVGWDLLIGSLFTHAIMRAWRADFSILNSMMAFIWRAPPVRPLLIARSIGDPSSEFVPSASRRVYRWLGLVAMRCRWVLFVPGNGVGDLNGFWHCHPPALASSL